MRYSTASAFRQALEQRIRSESQAQGATVNRLRKLVVFDRFMARLLEAAPHGWVLKGGAALNLRWKEHARTTSDLDLALQESQHDVIERLNAAAAVDLGDYFSFTVRRTGRLDDIDGGLAIRYHIKAQLAGRTFDEALLDVGLNDSQVPAPDLVFGISFLEFADIDRIQIPTIALEQHVAEKLHAYTRAYGSGGSMRVKDLVDLVLVEQQAVLHAGRLYAALENTFDGRGTHAIPKQLPAPPASWAVAYRRMAGNAGLDTDASATSMMKSGYEAVIRFLQPILDSAVDSESTWNPSSSTWAHREYL